MVKKVDDNHNEVLRGAAEYNSTDDKYDLRVKLAEILDDISVEGRADSHEQVIVNLRTIAGTLIDIREILKAMAE